MRLSALAHLPTQCEVCRRWDADTLCRGCRALFAPPVARCGRCGLRLGAGAGPCGECLQAPPPWQRAVVAFDYAFPWDRLIVQFKFHGGAALAGALAAPLAEAVRGAGVAGDAAAEAVDVIVPMPLARARLVERGYNQAWELARALARTLGRPAHAHALLRAIDTPSQAGLGRAEREHNLRGAFAPGPGARAVSGQRVALVDDVLTTGASARAASAALLRAGAAAVQLWVLARTPAPSAAS